jgi:hypothetical protein
MPADNKNATSGARVEAFEEFDAFFRKEVGQSIEAHGPSADFENISERNLYVKAAMVTELVEMGFSLEAIERVLNLESEVLDRLL